MIDREAGLHGRRGIAAIYGVTDELVAAEGVQPGRGTRPTPGRSGDPSGAVTALSLRALQAKGSCRDHGFDLDRHGLGGRHGSEVTLCAKVDNEAEPCLRMSLMFPMLWSEAAKHTSPFSKS